MKNTTMYVIGIFLNIRILFPPHKQPSTQFNKNTTKQNNPLIFLRWNPHQIISLPLWQYPNSQKWTLEPCWKIQFFRWYFSILRTKKWGGFRCDIYTMSCDESGTFVGFWLQLFKNGEKMKSILRVNEKLYILYRI